MDFLKEILGEELHGQVAEKINAHNGNEANKNKQIKLANLGGGEYVGKAKHDSEIEKLTNLLSDKSTELDTANGLIAELQQSAKGNQEMQGKLTEYQNQVAQLQEQLKQTQIDSALKIAFLEAGVIDIDYMTFCAKKNSGDKSLELGEDGKINGMDDLLSGLKTQHPGQFKKDEGMRIDENPLPQGTDRKDEPQSLADALRLQYENKK